MTKFTNTKTLEKVVLLGASDVGKDKLYMQITGEESVVMPVSPIQKEGDKSRVVFNLPSANQTRGAGMQSNCRDAAIYLLCFDVNDKNSLDKLNCIIRNIPEDEIAKHPKFILVGTGNGVVNGEISAEQISAFRANHEHLNIQLAENGINSLFDDILDNQNKPEDKLASEPVEQDNNPSQNVFIEFAINHPIATGAILGALALGIVVSSICTFGATGALAVGAVSALGLGGGTAIAAASASGFFAGAVVGAGVGAAIGAGIDKLKSQNNTPRNNGEVGPDTNNSDSEDDSLNGENSGPEGLPPGY